MSKVMKDKVIEFFLVVFLDYLIVWILAALGVTLIILVGKHVEQKENCLVLGYNEYSLGYCTHPAKDPVLLSEVEL